MAISLNCLQTRQSWYRVHCEENEMRQKPVAEFGAGKGSAEGREGVDALHQRRKQRT